MISIDTIIAYYNVITYKRVKKNYSNFSKDKINQNLSKTVMTINFDYDNLNIKFSNIFMASYDLLDLIRYFFEEFDPKEERFITKHESSMNLFFKEGLYKFSYFGLNIKFNFKDKIKERFIYRFISKEDSENIELLSKLVTNFDKLKECSFKALYEITLKEIEEEKEIKRIEDEITCDLELSWDAFFNQDNSYVEEEILSIGDAFILSLNNLGEVDLEYISKRSKKTYKEIIETLKGTIYQNPLKWQETVYKGWETSDEYLSGNVYKKLELAKEMNNKYFGYFSDNVKALENILPNFIDVNDIYVTLGSPWIPADVIDSFIIYITRYKFNGWNNILYRTIHDTFTGTWEVPQKNRSHSVRVNKTYGTSRINALHILEKTLNMKSIAIYDEVKGEGDKKYKVLNQNATIEANEKQQLLITTFQQWIWSDKERKERLLQIYQDKYCTNIIRKFNGDFLTFPNMNKNISLYDYQKNAVARIIFTPNTLLAHDVGAGKTFVMCAAGMELRRLGISKKNLYVVPNSVIAQWEEIFRNLYPDANLLCIYPNKFTTHNRDKILRKIKDEDYDGILIAYSSFELVHLSQEYLLTTLEEEYTTLVERNKKHKNSTKQLRNKIETLKKKINELKAKAKDNPDTLYFNDLGINTIFLDEAHNYKNVPINTKINRILGLSISGSNKCAEMLQKVHYVQKTNNGRGAVFATGTPITNSLTDIFVMQKYLQDGELTLLDLNSFDSWIGMFAEKKEEFEVDVDTSTYRLATRFREYHNLPELSHLLSNIADFYQIAEINEIPIFDGYSDEIIPQTIFLKDYLSNISKRADLVRKHKVKRIDDNMLKITTDGRKAALDIRLIDSNLYPYRSKVDQCVSNVLNIYHNTYEQKSTQLIFCDMSTPKEGFNLYDDIKEKLIDKGVSPSEIAFIHDAKTEKERLNIFDKMQNGIIRILLGSTIKLGLGVNVQNKLIALHHLDIPWRPADMTQREGRILRRGNENSIIEIYRYLTSGSFDAYSWQLLESKQKMIASVLSGSMNERKCKEVDDLVLSYAEVKALSIGNPLIKKRIEITNEISRLKILQDKYVKNNQMLKFELFTIPKKIKNLEENLELAILDKEYYNSNKVELNTELRREYREMIYKEILDHDLVIEEKIICNYQGFDIIMPTNMLRNNPYVYIKKHNKYQLYLGMTDGGIIPRIDNFLEGFEKYINNLKQDIDNYNTRIYDIKELLSNNDGYSDRIFNLKEELENIDKELGVNA